MQVSSDSSSTYTNYAYSSSGMSGMVSGMDTESLVKSMLSGLQTKIDTQNQQKQQLLWKQEMYRDVISKINTFQSKYLDITSSTSLRTNSFFNAVKTESSSSAVKVLSASSGTAQDISVQVAQLATASKLTSGSFSTGTVSMDTASIEANLADFFSTPEQNITFTAGDVTVDINLCDVATDADGKPSLENMVEAINNQLRDGGINATVEIGEDNKLKITADTNDVGEIKLSGSSNALSTLGLKAMTFNSEKDSYESTTSADASKLNNVPPEKAEIKVSLDGVSKTISIANGTKEEVMDSFKEQMKNAFGSSVTIDEDGNISARQGQTLSFSGDVSVLGLEEGACTRLTTSSTLEELGITDYKFTINGKEFEFEADSTVSDVMNKINSSNVGAKLTYNSLSDSFSLTSTSTGMGFDLEVSGGIADSFFKNSTFTAGQNAVINIDGTTVERTSNVFSYNGVTMEARDVTGDYYNEDGNLRTGADGSLRTADGTKGTAAISAERDVEKITETIKSFVKDYNTLIEDLNKLTHASKTYKNYDPLTDAQKEEMKDDEITKWTAKAKEGLLSGDKDISSFLTSMRSALYSTTENGTSLMMFGINSSSEWKDYGKLEIDEEALAESLTNNADAVISTFTSVANDLNNACKATANTSSVSPGSLVAIAGVEGKISENNNTIKTRLDNIADRIKQLQNLYDMRKERYWASFNSMETALSNMTSTSAYLSQMTGGYY